MRSAHARRRRAGEQAVLLGCVRILTHLSDVTHGLGATKRILADLAAVPLLIIDDLGVRKLPHTAAEDLKRSMQRRRTAVWAAADHVCLRDQRVNESVELAAR
jgi:hypothetical protein